MIFGGNAPELQDSEAISRQRGIRHIGDDLLPCKMDDGDRMQKPSARKATLKSAVLQEAQNAGTLKYMIVLSYYQVMPLLAARACVGERVEISLDLNRSRSLVEITEAGILAPDGQSVSWAALEEIADEKRACFLAEADGLERIHFFSRQFQRAYSLLPTENAPTMLLASFPMHRIKGIDPQEDTRRKIRAIAPVLGATLDTTMGLGYTAIEAAKTASSVLTLEIDPTVYEVAKRNPWSQELFTNPKIERRTGSAADVLPTLRDDSFQTIIHDPPTFKLAGDLYSEAFYRQLFRVLKRGGKVFHYIGDLDSASGRTVAKGVVQRLQNAGFRRVNRVPEAFGLTAF